MGNIKLIKTQLNATDLISQWKVNSLQTETEFLVRKKPFDRTTNKSNTLCWGFGSICRWRRIPLPNGLCIRFVDTLCMTRPYGSFSERIYKKAKISTFREALAKQQSEHPPLERCCIAFHFHFTCYVNTKIEDRQSIKGFDRIPATESINYVCHIKNAVFSLKGFSNLIFAF